MHKSSLYLRKKILDYRENNPEFTQRELAIKCNLSLTGLKYHLRILRDKHGVIIENINTKRKPYWAILDWGDLN